MGSLAADLKTEREKRSISLAQIAADTRISIHYLESLEDGRYGDLPGGMYNRAFLRAYCQSLNLDQREIMQRYDGEVASPAEKPQKPRIHIPQKSSSIRPNPVLIWSIALLVSAIGIFFSRHWIAAVFSPYFSRQPAATLPQALVLKPASIPAAEKASPEAAPALEPTPATKDDSPNASTATPAAEPSVTTQAIVPAAPPADASPPPPQSALQLELGVSEQCWISVEQDGTRSFRKLMTPGEIQRLYASEQFFVIVGNAGGVQMKINGKPVKPLGRSGEVIKILITEKNLQDYLVQPPG